MRAALLGPIPLVLAVATLACGPLRPPAIDPSGLADPTVAQPSPETDPPFDLLRYVRLDPPAPPPPAEPGLPARDPISVANCPFQWTPKDLHASVMVIPAKFAGRFLNPLYQSACACSRPGERLFFTARVVPELGQITIKTAAVAEPPTRVEPGVDACLAEFTKTVTFEPFEMGSDSDVVCPEPPPKEKKMGPPFFRPPRMVGCGGSSHRSTIVYPLLVDRSAGG